MGIRHRALPAAALAATRRLTPSPPSRPRGATENIAAFNIDAALLKPEDKPSS